MHFQIRPILKYLLCVSTPSPVSISTVCLLTDDPRLVSEFQQVAYMRGFQLKLAKSPTLEGGDVLDLPSANIYAVDAGVRALDPAGAVADVISAKPTSRVLVLVEEFNSDTAFPLLSMGVRGLLVRSEAVSQLSNAIEAIASGGFWVPRTLLSGFIDSVIGSVRRTKLALGRAELDESESRLMDALLDQSDDDALARELNLSLEDLKDQIADLLRKFGVRRRADLMLLRLASPASNVA
jgi:DNA-binding NarL/FixJ family response regulator